MRSPGDYTAEERRILGDEAKAPESTIEPIDDGPDAPTFEQAEAFRRAAAEPEWPEPAAGGTTIGGDPNANTVEGVDWEYADTEGADHDFMASQWIPFALGALCSSIIWFAFFL